MDDGVHVDPVTDCVAHGSPRNSRGYVGLQPPDADTSGVLRNTRRSAEPSQAICLLTSSLKTPPTSMRSLNEPLCTTFPACIT